MTTLPLEIIEDILRRLPVKSLKRFCVVAKSWYTLIESENFMKLHLRQSQISKSNRNLLIGGVGLYSTDLDALDKAHAIKPPFYYKSVDWISNSCNGIVLVMSDPPVLWNPFSTEYKVLPASPVEYPAPMDSFCKIVYGFGYDSKNDDYKVVRIVEFRHKLAYVRMASETKIYSHQSNSWRRIEDFPYPLPFLRSNWRDRGNDSDFPYPLPFLRGNWRAHVNGSLHTVVEDPNVIGLFRIMCFNVHTEEHYHMLMPPGFQTRTPDVTVDVFEGSLSVVCTSSQRVVIWIMKDYGVKESWVKLLSISPPAIDKNDFLKPLVYSRNGNKVLLNCDDKRLIWYDSRTKTVDDVLVEGMPFVFYAESCVQSLVPLNKRIEFKKQVQVKNKEKVRIKRDEFLSEGFKLVL